MASATHIKVVKKATGKTKYQAQVYHKGIFYCSKTFDLEKLAREYKEQALRQIVRGELKPARERAAARRAHTALELPMTHWAKLYVERGEHGRKRLDEYLLVGRLLADKKLKDFQGRPGAHLIEQLKQEWRTRQARSLTPRTPDAATLEPLKDNTVRLRLTALMRLIRFGKSKLPSEVDFRMPAVDELFDFKLPAAHSTPREREPSDAELARLLEHIEPESDFGHFLRLLDETGCRLSEVRLAQRRDVHFFRVAGEVVGGYLTLGKHKTADKIGGRKVPLSLFAARMLQERMGRYEKRGLFEALGPSDKVCKAFDDACSELGIDGLHMKDIRRAFINRNKYSVAHIDMLKIVGKSSMLKAEDATSSERNVLEAVGHTSIETTAGYSNLRLMELAQVFTSTSRWTRVASLFSSATERSHTLSEPAPDVAMLQQVLSDTLAQLARAGITIGSPS